MDFRELCAEVRKMDLVSYLAECGIVPKYNSNQNYWYCSPLRSEKTPSFKVDRIKNLWYDFGEGKGGSIIDFAIDFHKCTIAEFVHSFASLELRKKFNFSLPPESVSENQSKIEILKVGALVSPSLLHYISQRGIALHIADQYCKEVNYRVNGNEYYAVGFENHKGGYELRNKLHKYASSPKAITFIDNRATSLVMFEGFFDFLTYKTIIPENETHSYLVMNGLGLMKFIQPIVENHNAVFSYLDHGKGGDKVTEEICKWNQNTTDCRTMYKGYVDLNEFRMHFGKIQKPDSIRRTLKY